MQGLKDIKPLVAVPDYSLWMLIGLILLSALIMIALYFWFKKPKRKRRKRKTEKEIAKEALQNIDFSDSKKAVYEFSAYAPILTHQEEQAQLAKVIEKLTPYKYKKEVPPLSEADKKAMQKIIKEVVDVV